jgi:hypothetical protein
MATDGQESEMEVSLFSTPASNIVPKRKKPHDIVDSIRERLAVAKDFGDQTTLLCLGIDMLKRRQQSKGQR